MKNDDVISLDDDDDNDNIDLTTTSSTTSSLKTTSTSSTSNRSTNYNNNYNGNNSNNSNSSSSVNYNGNVNVNGGTKVNQYNSLSEIDDSLFDEDMDFSGIKTTFERDDTIGSKKRKNRAKTTDVSDRLSDSRPTKKNTTTTISSSSRPKPPTKHKEAPDGTLLLEDDDNDGYHVDDDNDNNNNYSNKVNLDDDDDQIDADNDDPDFIPAPQPKMTKRQAAVKATAPKRKDTRAEAKRLKEANRKKSKKESMGEMKMVIDNNLYQRAETGDLMSIVDGKSKWTFDTRSADLPIQYSIIWKRGHEEPFKQEDIIILKYPNDVLYGFVESNTLVQTISSIVEANPNKRLILLVEGLDMHLKSVSQQKAKTVNSILKGNGNIGDINPPEVKKFCSRQDFDKLFVELQFKYSLMIRVLGSREECALYLVKLTETISQIPYREDTSKLFQGFCSDAIKKRSKDPNQIWINQLVTISGVSRAIASTIVMKYPTIQSLYKDYFKSDMNEKSRMMMLKDLKLDSSQKRLGPVLSTRLYNIFCGNDPNKIVP
ncbi:hypothetical protein SAMD00019534_037500 [Acytostelium subglobosum LB1]|uniref:hypothetical protein n=1 Tax=Acytostelium subglobosum LB1 TaxID=1410327 RepID=UPI0006449359|nr:hypothetical protein SAMD00019534_037500 [Acytostelium subglobosum LB1]GAM20575.1 hypothetical protein SAMD00019534_037500 [Acytostelium subglobosum LB1]|eukprot:XP_012760096.1 hypothetical protein SAMD00019534_037500 [Acytostelium subglobosum LB1]